MVREDKSSEAERETLQQARGTQTRHRIGCYLHRLPPEDPTSHRKPQRRVPDMNQLHGTHPRFRGSSRQLSNLTPVGQ